MRHGQCDARPTVTSTATKHRRSQSFVSKASTECFLILSACPAFTFMQQPVDTTINVPIVRGRWRRSSSRPARQSAAHSSGSEWSARAWPARDQRRRCSSLGRRTPTAARQCAEITSYHPGGVGGGGETICSPAMAVRLAADLRPSADGSAVHTWLICRQPACLQPRAAACLRLGQDRRTDHGIT